jgi:TolB-like protein
MNTSPIASAVFLSYASQDAEAARALVAALRAAGVEVWFDQNELVGGDAWDAKIRQQIAACALFIPVISAATQARREGYFRLEWKLAAQRTHMMSERTAFLLPVVIDATRDAEADVPVEFKAVQWTRLHGGEAAPAFIPRVRALLGSPVNRQAVSPPATMPVRHFPGGSRRLAGAAALAFAGILAVVALLFLRQTTGSPEPATAAAAAPDVAPAGVAVMAFANLSSEKDSEYFSDGLSEEILDRLARHRGLRVIARTSSFYYKGKNTPVPQIGRELNVAHVIDGSVRRAGNRLRITAQLIDAKDGAQVWTETFDRELTDVFALQAEIAQRISARLTQAEASPAPGAPNPPDHAPTANPEAYDLYLRGRALQSRSAQGAEAAVPFFQKAVALDPAFALAWTQLSNATSRLVGANVDRSPERIARARTALARSLALQPDLPETLVGIARLAVLVDRDLPLAERMLAKAEARAPPTANLRQVQSQLARARNDYANWRRLLTDALALDPQNGDLRANAAGLFGEIGDFAECERLLLQTLGVSGTGSPTTFGTLIGNRVRWRGPESAWRLLQTVPDEQIGVNLRRGRVLLQLDRREEAREAFARGLQTELEPMRLNMAWARAGLLEARAAGIDVRNLAESMGKDADDRFAAGDDSVLVRGQRVQAEVLLGRKDEARRLLAAWVREAEAPELSDWDRRMHFRLIAPFYATLGDADEAVRFLEKWIKTKAQPGYELRCDVLFEPIRDDPRFQEIMRRTEAFAAALPDPVDP